VVQDRGSERSEDLEIWRARRPNRAENLLLWEMEGFLESLSSRTRGDGCELQSESECSSLTSAFPAGRAA
jgi:hypothetical protein